MHETKPDIHMVPDGKSHNDKLHMPMVDLKHRCVNGTIYLVNWYLTILCKDLLCG